MLNKLLRPKWQHPDKNVRLEAVKQLEAGEQQTLQQIAESDNESEVRQAAISRLDSLSLLIQTHKQTHHPEDRPFIEQCWCAVLADPELTSPERAEHIILECKQPRWLAAIACHSIDPSHQMLALVGLTDETTILELLKSSNNHRLLQTLVQQLQTEDALKQALSIIEGRDKRSQQIIREKRDAIKQAHEAQQQQAEQIIQIEQRLQQLLAGEDNPLFEGTFLNLRQQWHSACDAADDTTAERINSLLADCENRLQAFLATEQANKEQQKTLETLNEDSKQLLEKLQTELATSDEHHGQSRQMREQLADLQEYGDKQLLEAVTSQLDDITQLLEQLEQIQQLQLSLPDSIAEVDNTDAESADQAIADCQQAIAVCRKSPLLKEKQQHFDSLLVAIKKKHKQQKQLDREKTKQLQNWIGDADKAIAEDKLQEAARLLQKIRSTTGEMAEEQARPFNSAIQRIQSATRNLKDWKDFATQPKRHELCERMATLIEAELSPPDKADAIKALQNEWKALGFCEDQALWQQFQDLGDQAFAPCKIWFAEQKEKMHFNAEQRTTICEQLEQFLEQTDWENCNFRDIDRLYKSINDEWKKFAPVPNKKHKALQKRFYNSRDKLREKLNEERRKNTDYLAELVDKANALADNDDIDQAINDYQQLHEQWKKTGISFHKAQQALWQQLREAGNAIYSQRNNLREQNELEQQTNLEQAESIIADIQSLSKKAQIDPARFNELKKQFNAVPSIPKKALRDTRTAFNNACRAVEETQQKQQQQHFYQQLISASDAFQRNDTETLKQLPESWQALLAQPSGTDNAEEQARLLCITLEILCDKPTPEEDQQARMKLQMNKLARRFNNNTQNAFADDFAELYLSWQVLGYQNEPLASRFNELARAVIDNAGP